MYYTHPNRYATSRPYVPHTCADIIFSIFSSTAAAAAVAVDMSHLS